MFKVSDRNTRKRCLLVSKITLKTSEQRHLTTSYLTEVAVQNHVLDSFSQNIYQFTIKILLSVLLLSSTARNLNNSKPIYVILSSNINEVIRAVLNSLLFFTKGFYTHILTKHKIQRQKIKSSLPTFRQFIYTNGQQVVRTLLAVSTSYVLSRGFYLLSLPLMLYQLLTISKCEDS